MGGSMYQPDKLFSPLTIQPSMLCFYIYSHVHFACMHAYGERKSDTERNEGIRAFLLLLLEL